tara:strand:- start:676 stop:1188 length:513 start_codon:yes stop_codon:yes gene_type:complete
MLRSNFFYKLFNYKKNNSYKIVKYNSFANYDLKDELQAKILDIDKRISENSKALLEAQIVKFRSTFANSKNFVQKIGTSIYKTKLDESINFYQKKLTELYSERRLIQIHFEKIKGTFWLNRIKRFLAILLIGFLSIFIIFIFISGFMLFIYFLPVIILSLLGYWIVKKRN